MGNSVDIIIRAVEQGVEETFKNLKAALRAGQLSIEQFNASLVKSGAVKENLKQIAGQMSALGLMTEKTFARMNMDNVGVRSFAVIREEMARLTASYRNLAASGEVSSAELAKALESLRAKQKRLYAEMSTPPKLDFSRSLLGVNSFATVRKEMARLTAAYRDLKDSGKLSTEELGRALESLRAKQKGLYSQISAGSSLAQARSLLGIPAPALVEKEIAQLQGALATLAASGKASFGQLAMAGLATQQRIAAMRGEMSLFGTIAAGANKLISGVTASLFSFQATIAGVFAGLATRSLWDAGTQAQRLQLAFESIAGSADGAKAEFTFLRGEADRLGLVFYTVADSYKAIFAAAEAGNVDLATTRKIFSGFSESFAALGLNDEQVEGSLRAVSQMMGKNKVLAEELRTQLGEKLPVAIQTFAQAAGVSVAEFEKMMANGEVGIDIIAKTADLLSNKFGKKAEQASKMAFGSLARFKTAWWDFRVTLSESGFLDLATDALSTMAAAMKDPAVQESIRQLAKSFFELIGAVVRIGWEWKGVIAALVGSAVAISTISKLVAQFQLLNGVISAMAGGSLLTFAKHVQAASSYASLGAIAMGSLGGALTILTTVVGTFIAAFAIGSLLNKFETVQMAGNRMAYGLTKSFYMAQKAWLLLTLQDTTEVNRKLAEVEQIYQEMYDKIGSGAKETAEKTEVIPKAVAEGGRNSANAMGKYTEEMKKQFEDYAKEVIELTDRIAGKQQDLTAKLRDMGREGMSGISAWRDQRNEADEYYQAAMAAKEAAEQALAAGDIEGARAKYQEAAELAERAEGTYDSLSNTVEQNGRTVIGLQEGLAARMEGVEAAGKLGIEALNGLRETAAQAASSLDQISGGKLSKDMPELVKVFAYLDWQTEGLAKQSATFNSKWNDAWDEFLAKGGGAVWELDTKLSELTRDRHITVYVKEVVQKYVGGLVRGAAAGVQQFAKGGWARLRGKLPGVNGPDSIKALLAPGEFIIRSAAVRKYGVALFSALNSMRVDLGSRIGAMVGTGLSRIQVPTAEPVRMFAGGLAASGGGGNTYNLYASFAMNGSQSFTRRDADIHADRLLAALKRKNERSS